MADARSIRGASWDVVATVLSDRASDGIAIIALFSTANTVLLLLVAASRLLFGMASRGALSERLSYVHTRRQTPIIASGLCLVIAAAFASFGDIGLVAEAANFAIFMGFGAVNVSLIVLRLTRPGVERPFRVPGAIAGIPVLPIAALGTIALMIAHLEAGAIAIGVLIALMGAGASLISKERLAVLRTDPDASEVVKTRRILKARDIHEMKSGQTECVSARCDRPDLVGQLFQGKAL